MAGVKMEGFNLLSDNWQLYIERLEQYFIVNATKDDMKLPILITLMGAEGYELLVTLCTPDKPSTKKFEDVVQIMKNHLQPKPSILAERYKFRQRKQLNNESITEYVANLKKMSKNCEFGSWLDDSLRDQLVCGLNNDMMRQRLFTESDLKFSKARDLAIAMEAAEKNAAAVDGRSSNSNRANGESSGGGAMAATAASCHALAHERHERRGGGGSGPAGRGRAVQRRGAWDRAPSYGNYRTGGASAVLRASNARSTASSDQQRRCQACGESGHNKGECVFRNYVCRVCNREGHLKRVCPNLRLANTNYTDGVSLSEDEEDLQVNFSFVKDQLSKYKPFLLPVMINKKELFMEVDTGSTISCISAECYSNHFQNLSLEQSNLKLKYYTGETVSTLGKLRVTVRYQNQSKDLDLYVIDHGKTNLLGREWLIELGIKVFPTVTTQVGNLDAQASNFNLEKFSSRFKNVFADGLGRFTGGSVSLRMREDARPVFLRARPLAYALREPVERELERLQSEGIITPVETSDWATPIVPVVKPDGSIRICGDYKISLNKQLEVDRFPLPRVEDLFTRLHGGEKFTKLDLSQAYAQLVLDETSKYTVINTHKGLFKYNRLIYGLSSSPGIFQRKLEQMFADLPRVGVFLDDVILTGRNDQEHLENLYKVFERLEKYGLKIKKEKCAFLSDSVTYLGFVIDKHGVHTCPKKIEGIQKLAIPQSVSELRSFLGMVMYYAKFVNNISTILAPLYQLLKKNTVFEWTDECNEAFNKVKELLASSKVLAHYDPELELVLTTDASSVGVGAVISHLPPGGPERPIAYASRVLTTAEKGYSQIEKEALAIIYGIKKFHQYLYGRRFILKTDHKPLVAIFGEKAGIPVMAASCMQRWAILLSGYQYDIEYVPSNKNGADAFSRLPSDEMRTQTEKKVREISYFNFVQDFLPITGKHIKDATEKDQTLKKVVSFIRIGWPMVCNQDDLKPFYTRRHELYMENGCIMWGYRVVIPESIKQNIMKELHVSHMGVVKMKGVARSYVWWPGIDADVERCCRECIVCAAEAAAPPRVPPQPWPYHVDPWSRLHVDFLGPLDGNIFFVLIDSTTKWIEAFLMTRTTASAVIQVLRQIFARFGLPKEIVSDNGPPFSSKELAEFTAMNGIKHLFSPAYHPASNGAAEAAVKLCKRAIKKAAREKVDVEMALQSYLMNYRNSEHSATGQTPAMMLQRRSLRCRLDLLRATRAVEDKVQETQRRQIRYNSAKDRAQFKPGDQVWSQEFRLGEKWVPGTVSEVIGSRNYIVDKGDGVTTKKHINQLKKKSILCFPSGLTEESSQSPDVSREPPSPRSAPTAPAAPATPAQPPAAGASHSPSMNRPQRVRRPPSRYGFD